MQWDYNFKWASSLKACLRVSDKASFKPVSSATETSLKIEISPVASLHTGMIHSEKRITKALIRLRGCAGWSAPLLFANPRRQVFARQGPNENDQIITLQEYNIDQATGALIRIYLIKWSQGTKTFQYCTCPAGRVTYNFQSPCKHMHLSFKSVCNKEHKGVICNMTSLSNSSQSTCPAGLVLRENLLVLSRFCS